MIIKFLNFLFGTLVGKLPEGTKKELEAKFKDLLMETIKAGTEGAVAGMNK